jgi:hypothetical protein
VETEQSFKKTFGYGTGALIVLALSIGLAAVAYGGNFFPFYIFNLPAWIFIPLGIYTFVYSLIAPTEAIHYLVWGSVATAVGFASALYNVISIFVIFGALIIVIAIINLIAYVRRKT